MPEVLPIENFEKRMNPAGFRSLLVSALIPATKEVFMPMLAIAAACLVAPTPTPACTTLPQAEATGESQTPLLSIPGAVDAACAWLISHQDEDGHWDCAGFMKHDAAAPGKANVPLDDDDFWERALQGEKMPEAAAAASPPVTDDG